MLDANFPTYRLQRTSDPLSTLLVYTHNGSDPTPTYLLKRSSSPYAIALFDAHQPTILYGEVLLARASDEFSVLLYNPDAKVTVRTVAGGFRPDHWSFSMPERTFRLPSASKLDRDQGGKEWAPRTGFAWRRDGRLSKDLSCYMVQGGEADVVVAMCGRGKVCLYEPNMARVEVEDGKGLEVVLLLSAVVLREVYVSRGFFGSQQAELQQQQQEERRRKEEEEEEEEEEERRRRAEEERMRREEEGRARREEEERRLKREEEEIRRMLQREEEEARRKKEEVERETERLRREYGVDTLPELPPRPTATTSSAWAGRASGRASMSGANGGRMSRFRGLYGHAPAVASVSNLNAGDERKKMRKKQSVHF